MHDNATRLAGCKYEVEDCRRLLARDPGAADRAAVLRRLDHARRQLRALEDEMRLSPTG